MKKTIFIAFLFLCSNIYAQRYEPKGIKTDSVISISDTLKLKAEKVIAPNLTIENFTNPKDLVTKEIADSLYSGGGSGTTYTPGTLIDITANEISVDTVASDARYVKKSGDTMTGELSVLGLNSFGYTVNSLGFSVGSTRIIYSSGGSPLLVIPGGLYANNTSCGIYSLSGTGNRVVTANSTGVLSATTTIPEQVNITGGTGINVSGTYPNIEIAATGGTTLNELTDVIPAGTGEDGYVLTYKETENQYAFTSIAESESTWQTVTLDATNTTAGTLQIKKIGTDLILIGDFTSVSLLADGSDIFTLPVDYRPDYPRRINLYSVEGKSEAFVSIGVDGVGSIYFFDGNSGGASAANYFVDAEFRTLINLTIQQ